MPAEIKRYTAYKLAVGLIKKGKPELETDKDDPTRERFRYLTLEDKEINRVNLIANVTNKFQSDEKAYISLTVDDGTGQMQVKAFSDNIKILKEVGFGDTILIIGNLRYFNHEVYILPEIVKTLDARWLLARKLELKEDYKDFYEALEKIKLITTQSTTEEQKTEEIKKQPVKQEIVEKQEINEEKIQTSQEQKQEEEKTGQEQEQKPETLRDQVIETIKAAETDEGIDIDKIIMKLNSYSVEEINNLITSMLEEGTIYEPRPGRLRIL